MKVRNVMLNLICVSLLVTLLYSCSDTQICELGSHTSITIKIDPENMTKSLEVGDYSIDSVCSLAMPNNVKYYSETKFIVKNNRIYVMDSDYNHTIYVFDISGAFMFKLGERGRAAYEYIGGPIDFFVDEKNDVFVFDKVGQKVLTFSRKGDIYSVVQTQDIFPYSFGLTYKNRYMYCKSDQSDNSEYENVSLLVTDYNHDNLKKLLPFEKSYVFRPCTRNFFRNGMRLSHIPILSDSVIVFKRDTVEKVVHFDFNGNFLAQKSPELVSQNSSIKEISSFAGVHSLKSYQETDSLVLLEYIYNTNIHYWLYNKNTKSICSTDILFDGVYPYSDFILEDNQLIAFIDTETVNILRKYREREDFKENLKKSPNQIEDIINGDIPTPAIVYISLKNN